MRRRYKVVLGLALGLSAGGLLGHGLAGRTAAQDRPASPTATGAAMPDILVTPAIANNDTPAALTLDLSNSRISPQSRLELSVTPEKVSPNEAYLVVVSPAGEPTKQLGSFAFFPPPRAGETRKFLVDVPEITADKAAKTKLSVELVPVDAKEALASSSVRIVGARVVGN